MILTCLKKSKLLWLGVALVLGCLCPFLTNAQGDSVSLSVTPTLFEMSAAPQQVWQSNVKVVNNNPYELTVYADVVNFAPQGETGQGKFLPVFENFTEGTTLAEWITITAEPIILKPGESKPVPFAVEVPEDASPGGHFAAIMVGTRPPSGTAGFEIKTSQVVTSLFFVRIAGDVVEDGAIREFRTAKGFYSTAEADFELRFENKGNVHIQPQGEIVITNMWGRERGLIPINHKTHFGNVLPESIRKFDFSWKGELNLSDIGRYSAKLALVYGSDQRKFVTSTTHFWVVPIKSVIIFIVVLAAISLFISWAIRTYIRHMLALEGYQFGERRSSTFAREGDVLVQKGGRIDAPVRAGWFDLQERLKHTEAFFDTLKALLNFAIQYRVFFGAVVGVIVIIIILSYFIGSVTQSSRDYEVTIDNPDTDVTISSEEILYDQQTETESSNSVDTDAEIEVGEPQGYEIVIVNSSDTTGQAAAMQRQLEPGYEIARLESDFGEPKDRSVIVYHKDLQAEALELRERLGEFILSALPPENDAKEITIYIGNDYTSP